MCLGSVVFQGFFSRRGVCHVATRMCGFSQHIPSISKLEWFKLTCSIIVGLETELSNHYIIAEEDHEISHAFKSIKDCWSFGVCYLSAIVIVCVEILSLHAYVCIMCH